MIYISSIFGPVHKTLYSSIAHLGKKAELKVVGLLEVRTWSGGRCKCASLYTESSV